MKQCKGSPMTFTVADDNATPKTVEDFCNGPNREKLMAAIQVNHMLKIVVSLLEIDNQCHYDRNCLKDGPFSRRDLITPTRRSIHNLRSCRSSLYCRRSSRWRERSWVQHSRLSFHQKFEIIMFKASSLLFHQIKRHFVVKKYADLIEKMYQKWSMIKVFDLENGRFQSHDSWLLTR